MSNYMSKVISDKNSEKFNVGKNGKIEKTLDDGIKEGEYVSVSTALGSSYFEPLVIFMNATSSQLGILHGIIGLLPALVQLQSSKLISLYSRKKIIIKSIFYRLLLWIPTFIILFLFYLGFPNMVWLFIIVAGLTFALNTLSYPAWFSWMGSLVPEKNRGTYFSKRNMYVGIFGVASMILGAIILDYSTYLGERFGDIVGFTLLGFGLLFGVSLLSRLKTIKYFKRMYEPKLKVRKEDYFSFWQFLKRAPLTPFGRFAIFGGFFWLAVGISSPFFAVYMIRNLGFSYFWLIFVTVSSTMFQLIFLPMLGRISDRFGNIKLLKISSWIISLIPLFWFFSSMIEDSVLLKVYLIVVPSLLSGFGWSGYNLATNNFVYDSVIDKKVGFGVSYMNLVVGVGLFIGALIGSYLALFNFGSMQVILAIFLISLLTRVLVVVFGLRYLREVRYVEDFKSNYLIKEFIPTHGAVRMAHNFEHFVEKMEKFI